jgi:hypothetical protein
MNPFIYIVSIDGIERNVLSLLPSEEVFSTGLKGTAIVGYVFDPSVNLSVNNVQINPAFVSLFQKVVCTTSLKAPALKEAAHRQQQGFIYIIDQRDRNYPNTKGIDVIGAFAVKDGMLQEDSYQPNPNYQIVSEDGLFQLSSDYVENLLAEMRQ